MERSGKDNYKGLEHSKLEGKDDSGPEYLKAFEFTKL